MAPLATILNSHPDIAGQILDAIEVQFKLDDIALTRITAQFLQEIANGLAEYGQAMAIIPTFVTGVPSGKEEGTFLALDLGGTNLRVCEVKLNGDHTFSLRQQKYKVSDQLKTGEATALFDYLADSVDAFLTSESPDAPKGEDLPLGLTFSFPVEQTALDSGHLLTWTKGFAAKNAVGHDIVKLLQDAFNRKHLHVKCVALVNDTVGALLSRSYTAGGCLLGAIFGTGTNGAYVEDLSKLTKLKDEGLKSRGGKMIVNTEWGAFNNSRSTLPTTPFDNKLDRESINPRFQAFEKFISGMYLGEITRNILLALVDAAPKPLLFNGRVGSGSLNNHYGLDTAVMSDVELAWAGDQPKAEPTEDVYGVADKLAVLHLGDFDEAKLSDSQKQRLERVRKVIIYNLGFEETPEDVSLNDAAIVRWACTLVAERAAKLSGCAVAAILVQTGCASLGTDDGIKRTDYVNENGKIGVGVDGSLIQFYPNFETQLRDSLRHLVGKKVEEAVEIGMAKDGSGVGAALGALIATQAHST
ncbi:hexokinase [Thelephora ganbajun]|uniref:Hexokinase n=1 Tax=Thelephora ganbajun TaxID=370292 RepID=A0ACB6ZJ36_THEGA|nr:hexokinase [Thelephora ganbajun]